MKSSAGKNVVYVITRKPRGGKTEQPVCFQDTRADAVLYVKLLREDCGRRYTFNIRPIRKGCIRVDLTKD